MSDVYTTNNSLWSALKTLCVYTVGYNALITCVSNSSDISGQDVVSSCRSKCEKSKHSLDILLSAAIHKKRAIKTPPSLSSSATLQTAPHSKVSQNALLSLCRRCSLYSKPIDTTISPPPPVQEPLAAAVILSPLPKKEWDLLLKMLLSINLTLDNCAIIPIVRCPISPAALAPSRTQVDACKSNLDGALKALGPRLILAFGVYTAFFLTGLMIPLNVFRSRVSSYNNSPCVYVTYSPADLLKSPALKRAAYSDLLRFRAAVEPKPFSR